MKKGIDIFSITAVIVVTSIFVMGVMPHTEANPGDYVEAYSERIERALNFIIANQGSGGGFSEPGRSSAVPLTAWTVLGLCAAGRNPHDIRMNGSSSLDFMAERIGDIKSAADVERTIIAAAAAGEDLRSFGGVDLIARLEEERKPDGRIGNMVNSTLFGAIAYSASGMQVPHETLSRIKTLQNPDGGWPITPGGLSSPDMTAAAIMALASSGNSASDEVRRALVFLKSAQHDDGGFSMEGGSSDCASTAWVVMALNSIGENPNGAKWNKENTPLGRLIRFQQPDGRFHYMDGRDQNPVWMTAYAVVAISGKTFPVSGSFKSPGRKKSPDNGEPANDERREHLQPEGHRENESGTANTDEAGEPENHHEASEAGQENGTEESISFYEGKNGEIASESYSKEGSDAKAASENEHANALPALLFAIGGLTVLFAITLISFRLIRNRES